MLIGLVGYLVLSLKGQQHTQFHLSDLHLRSLTGFAIEDADLRDSSADQVCSFLLRKDGVNWKSVAKSLGTQTGITPEEFEGQMEKEFFLKTEEFRVRIMVQAGRTGRETIETSKPGQSQTITKIFIAIRTRR